MMPLKKRESRLSIIAYACRIPATWEVQIRRIAILGQPGQKVSMTPSQSISWVW
jgi:hypothetical protein